MTFIADVFLKWRTPKNVVKQISKKSSFTGPFDKQHAKEDQKTVEKSTTSHLPYLLITVKATELEEISL